MDLGLFFGRFHPLIVHLPIGIILVTLVLEWWGKTSKATLRKLWWYGALTAILSAFIGWLLAGNAAYAPSSLWWHKWLGFATCAVTLGIWSTYKFDLKLPKWTPHLLRVGVFLLLGIGGHKGGTLTHGDGYLVAAAPAFIQKMVGYNTGGPTIDLTVMDVDSIVVYRHLVFPILEQRCIGCHSPDALNGGLDLSNKEGLEAGGDGGVVYEAGNAFNSELFKRVILVQSDEKFMPPNGIPMTFHEIEILKSWINEGASFDGKVSDLAISKSMINAVQSVYNVDLTPRPWYLKEIAPTADSIAIAQLLQKDYQVMPFSQEDNYLKVVLPRNSQFTSLDLAVIKENIIIIEAKQSDFSDSAIAELGIFSNLLRLDLSNSTFNPQAFDQLGSLSKLEVVNLFGSGATDATLEQLVALPSLKRVYTWQSKITEEGIAAFESKRGDVVVESGL